MDKEGLYKQCLKQIKTFIMAVDRIFSCFFFRTELKIMINKTGTDLTYLFEVRSI